MKRDIIIVALCALLMAGCGASSTVAESGSAVTEAEEENTAAEAEAEEETDIAEKPENAEEEPDAEPVTEEAETATESKDEMIKELTDKVAAAAKVSSEEVKYGLVEDFDKDGSFEGFFFTGGSPDEEFFNACDGTVWFASDREAKELYSGSIYTEKDEMFRIMDCMDRKFILFDEAYTTSLVSFVYYVDGSVAKESVISRIGDIDKKADPENLILTLSAYDSSLSYEEGDDPGLGWSGHTWKPYYYFYDEGSGDFREYGGTKISEAELADIVGFDLVKEISDAGFKTDDIFRRKNGIINVNYSRTEKSDIMTDIEYHNVTYNEKTGSFFDVWDAGEKTWQNSDYGGIYAEALSPDIASF
jgi:hypothetical protein